MEWQSAWPRIPIVGYVNAGGRDRYRMARRGIGTGLVKNALERCAIAAALVGGRADGQCGWAVVKITPEAGAASLI